MLSPALETQYSPRLTLANVLEIDVMKTIWGSSIDPGRLELDHGPGDGLGQEERPAQVGRQDAVPALGRRLQQVEPGRRARPRRC